MSNAALIALGGLISSVVCQRQKEAKEREETFLDDSERIQYLEKKIEYLEKRIELLLLERENNNLVSSKSESRPPNRSRVPGLYIPECNYSTCVEKRKKA